MVNNKNKEILRELAKKQVEIANSEKMKALKKEWLLHNTFQGQRPMITVEFATFAEDIVPNMLKCDEPFARGIEKSLLINVINHTYFGDDTIVRDYIPINYHSYFKPFDLDVKVEHIKGNDNSLGYHFVPIIYDLEEDFGLIKKSTFGFDREKAQRDIEMFSEIFGDSIPVKLKGYSLYTALTQKIVNIMSMETMFISMYDYPELFKSMINQLADDYIEYYKLLESEKLLLPTASDEHLCQGTYCFTDELPSDNVSSTKDIWGFMDSQETVGISNEMFGEFIFPAYKKVADSVGLLSYGCCEPVDPIWDDYISKFENLRKVSISPWCNEKIMGEKLLNKKVIFHRKPSPNYLGVGDTLDEEALRQHIKATLDAAKGCKIEFTQRDVYQVGCSVQKVKRFVDILKEECDKYSSCY